jgi:hypothetical protein
MTAFSVAFVHVLPDSTIATLMVASVRSVMPGVEIVQMSEPDTAAVPGVDTVIRREREGMRLTQYRLAHFAALERPAILFIDPDVIVQRPVDHVFEQPFDVALTVRHERMKDLRGVNLTPLMPYNMGVSFSRQPRFWAAAGDHCGQLAQDEFNNWYGDQLSIKHVADTGAFRVLELPCDQYNYSPRTEDEDVEERYAVHYKGQRKEWMMRRFGPRATPHASRKHGLLMQVLLDIFRRR